MKHAVNVTLRAERDLARLYGEIEAANSETARESHRGLKKRIFSLEKLPFRSAITPENRNLRHLLYGHRRNTYRVIYRVVGMRVNVLHVRHGARKKLR
jgi:plasmid stabilization system protein ParE